MNFGRSGNSTETLGTLDALDALAPNVARLNITCNRESALAMRAAAGPARVVCLPEASHDSGFAVTSSFATMLLTAPAGFDPDAQLGEMSAMANAWPSSLNSQV